jgi:TPR repeat protein
MRDKLSWLWGAILALYLLVLPQLGIAQEYTIKAVEGIAQDYITSERLKAEAGDAAAQYSLGLNYKYGVLGSPKDLIQAFDWFTKSANQGYPDACFELAKRHLEGNGVAKNEALGVEWLRKAHDYGPASLLMSDLYTMGIGVPQDQSEALRWLRLSAGQGYGEAQIKLGERYRTGQGVKQDSTEAVNWYSKALKAGSSDGSWKAANALGRMYETGDGVAQDLNKAAEFFELGGAAGKGARFRVYTKQAEQGDATAQFDLAKMYEDGDFANALKWYSKSAAQGNAEAAYNLGLIFAGLRHSTGWTKNGSEAKNWLSKAADMGHPNAQVTLAQLSWREWGDPDKAANLYRKAAEQHAAEAENGLGLMYESGEGVQRDDDKAAEWYSRAVGHGSEFAKANLDALMKSRQGGREIDVKPGSSNAASQQGSNSGETNGVSYFKSGNTVVGVDKSEHGAVLCVWQISYSIMLELKTCEPGRHRELQEDLAKSVDAINDFIVKNSPKPVTKEQLEKRISDEESKLQVKPDKCSWAAWRLMVMRMEQVSRRVRMKRLADLLSVPRPPVMNPCL